MNTFKERVSLVGNTGVFIPPAEDSGAWTYGIVIQTKSENDAKALLEAIQRYGIASE